jgi:hypothetical protein
MGARAQNAGSQIASCISRLTSSGVCDFSSLQGKQTIAQNVFAGAKANVGITLIVGPAAFTVSSIQYLPSNTTIECRGSSFIAAAGVTAWGEPAGSAAPGAPYGIFSNSNWHTYTTSGGRNINLKIEGCSLSGNGNGPKVEGIAFFGADHSILEENSLTNIAGNGINIRDGLSNIIQNNFCTNCGSAGHPYDAFGGGIQIDTFRYNKFLHNYATGGGPGIDHYDLWGQGKDVYCDSNILDGNTSDSSRGSGVVIDTCSNTQWVNNIVRGSASDSIIFSNGAANKRQPLGVSLIRGNIVTNAGGNGITLANNVNGTSVDSNVIVNAAHHGIVLEWSSQSSVTNNQIVNPSTSGGYSGIALLGNAKAGGAHNLVSNNYISSTSEKLACGIDINPGGSFEYLNIVTGNAVNISTAHWVRNGGTGTVLSKNIYSGSLQP